MAPGSVYQRGDGYWVAAVLVAGRKIVRYSRTERDAKRKLLDLQRQHYLGQLAPPARMPLAEWVQTWLRQHAADVRPSTLATYRQVLAPLAGRIGHVRIDRVTPALVASTIADLQAAGMGARRVQMCRCYLRTALRDAVRFGIIGANPVDQVRKPRYEPAERRYWTPDEARRFVSAATDSGHQHAPVLLFLLATGCRLGEALGLQWSDVDAAAGSVTIRRAVVWVDGRPTLQRPKTAAGVRTVALPGFGREALTLIPRSLDRDANVFVTEVGATPTKSNVRRALQALSRRASVPFVNVHGLRHVHAGLLLAAGIDPQALRRRLGHAHVSMTLDRYAYAVRPDTDAADALGRAVGVGGSPCTVLA